FERLCHSLRRYKGLQRAVAPGNITRVPDASRRLATNQDLAYHHQVRNIFEADRALVQLAAMLGGDAIEHARGVESAHYVARPLLAFEQPAEENRENLVGIDEAAVFGHGADAVGVAIRGKARV